MKKISFILIAIVLLQCTPEKQEISFNPFKVNTNINIRDLKHSDCEYITTEEGLCTYQKINNDSSLIFYLDLNNKCKSIHSIETSIKICELDSIWLNTQMPTEDSLKIISIIEGYNAHIVEGFKWISQYQIKFNAIDRNSSKIVNFYTTFKNGFVYLNSSQEWKPSAE